MSAETQMWEAIAELAVRQGLITAPKTSQPKEAGVNRLQANK